MRKSIVKVDWLPLAKLSQLQRQPLQSLVLNGELRAEADVPGSIRTALRNDENRYLLEKTAQIEGNPARLLGLLSELPQRKPEGADERSLWEERVFLKGFALSRLGKTMDAQAIFQTLPSRFGPRVRIEQALQRLNRGDLLEAKSMFESALEQGRGELDPYSVCTLLGGLSLSQIHQGEFREAESSLNERRKVLRNNPSPVLSFGTRLYEILLSLEKNDFARARHTLGNALSEENRDSVNRFFLLHLKLRLHLSRNDLESAGQAIEDLKRTMSTLNLTNGVLDLGPEEAEWELRSGRPEAARAKIDELQVLALARKDEFLHFRLTVLRSEISFRLGEKAKALGEITNALQTGEARNYRPMLTWGLFHASGIALAAGHPVQAKLFLNRGRRLARDLGLDIRLACFSYMSDVLDGKYASSSALISLAKHQEIGPELEYYLDAYELLDVVRLDVTSKGSRESVAEPELRRMLFKSPGVFWFQREAVLLANSNGVVHFHEFQKQSPLLACFRLLWNASQREEDGLSLKQIHKARSSQPFREDLHANAAKMLISRLRQSVAVCELEIRFDRAKGLYSLAGELPTFTIQNSIEEATDTSSKDREMELLERIAMEPFVTTKTLCEEFGVTRQALHPFLRSLVETGKVRLVRRGPVSGYVYRG